ncbi:acyl-CoA desaturase [bacterium]|nr:acyl-CoA desaturase [bacterium]
MLRKLNSYFWLIFLPAHLLLLWSLYKIEFTVLNIFLILFFWTLTSGYGIGVAFHRLLSHKSFKTWYPIEVFISYLGCLAIQGSPIFWVNIHRGYHHPHSDGEKDLHSPVKGKWWAYFIWSITIDYRSIKFDFVNDLLRKKAQRVLHYMYFFVVWLTWIAAYFISPAILFALVIAQIITLHQEFCVNLFCHSGKGYRNFDLPDRSVNRYFFGLLFWGVGYHNNHHARPNSYSFAYAENEFDPTVLLVKSVKKPS